MRVRRFEWDGAADDRGRDPRLGRRSRPAVVGRRDDRAREVREERRRGGAAADRRASTRPTPTPSSLRVDPGATAEALSRRSTPALREALELAAANIRAVAEAQVGDEPRQVELPQGQTVTLREVPVARRRHLRARAGAPPIPRAS